MEKYISKIKQTKTIMIIVSVMWFALVMITYISNWEYYVMMNTDLDLIYIGIAVIIVLRILCEYVKGKYRILVLITPLMYTIYFVYKFNHIYSKVQMVGWIIPIIAAVANNYIIENDNDKKFLVKSILISFIIEWSMLIPIYMLAYIL